MGCCHPNGAAVAEPTTDSPIARNQPKPAENVTLLKVSTTSTAWSKDGTIELDVAPPEPPEPLTAAAVRVPEAAVKVQTQTGTSTSNGVKNEPRTTKDAKPKVEPNDVKFEVAPKETKDAKPTVDPKEMKPEPKAPWIIGERVEVYSITKQTWVKGEISEVIGNNEKVKIKREDGGVSPVTQIDYWKYIRRPQAEPTEELDETMVSVTLSPEELEAVNKRRLEDLEELRQEELREAEAKSKAEADRKKTIEKLTCSTMHAPLGKDAPCEVPSASEIMEKLLEIYPDVSHELLKRVADSANDEEEAMDKVVEELATVDV